MPRAALAGAVLSGVLTVALADPALPVLGLAIVSWGARLIRSRLVPDAINRAAVVALFAVSVALGTLTGVWDRPARLLASAGLTGATAVGALAALVVNNLPAAAQLSAHLPPTARCCWASTSPSRARCRRSCGGRARAKPARGPRHLPPRDWGWCWRRSRWWSPASL